MNFSISTGVSLWFLLLCLVAGAGYALLLYKNNKKFLFGRLLRNILFVIRFVVISVIAFFLLSPLVKTATRQVEKPFIIIAHDNSQSVTFNKDSSFYKSTYPEKMNTLIEKLRKKYDVKLFSFGREVKDSIKYSFDENVTDISAVLAQVKTKFLYRNVGALILASDGLYNKGRNPLYASDFAEYPIYAVALGDTSVYKDIYINKINYNRLAYVGNKFPVEIVVKSDKCKGLSSTLSVTSNSKQLYSQNVNFNGNSTSQTFSVQLDAEKEGVIKLGISVKPVDGENTTANNYREIYIKVDNNRQKVLILSNSPHPDVAALKTALESNSNYDVESSLADDFTKSIAGYDLIVFHQLPSTTRKVQNLTSLIEKSGIPALFVIGAQSDFNSYNSLKTGLSIIVSNKSSQNEALPVVNNDFTFFTVSQSIKRLFDDAPPLLSPFATYKTSTASESFLYQKIGNVSTKQPLIVFSQQGNIRVGTVVGEGLWKWKLVDYKLNNSHENFNEVVGKMAQYLSSKRDSGMFRVSCDNSFQENESVSFDAELYNESFEMINDPEVSVTIVNENKISYPFVFNRTGKSYHLDAGVFAAGAYTWEAETKVGNKTHRKSGAFYISPLNIERITSTADHAVLKLMAQQHGGKMVYPSQLDDLLKELENRDDIKSISRIEKRFENMVSLFWLLVAVICLLSAEWFLRKWSGNY